MTNAPSPPSVQADPGEPGRIVVLLVLIATAALWLQHHLGFDFAKLGVVVLAGAVWGVVGKLADWLGEASTVGKFVDSTFKAPLQRLLRSGARPGALRVFGTGLAVVMATISSVTVQGETPGERTAVSIAPLGDSIPTRTDSLGPEHPVVRYRLLFTNPFGRLFQVNAKGYLPASITVYPLAGRQLVLGRDLAPSPSVLFRPFEEGVRALNGRAVFRVTRLNAGSREALAVDSPPRATSFLLGRAKRVPESMIAMWSLELAAVSAPEPIRAKLLVLWSSPRYVVTPRELAPHDCLLAEILEEGKVKARAQVTVTAEPLLDILMHDIIIDTVKVLPC